MRFMKRIYFFWKT